jgi:hypothetical protein
MSLKNQGPTQGDAPMCTERRTAKLWIDPFQEDGAMKFQINEGSIDRLVRILLGAGLFAISAAGFVTAPLLYVVLALAGWVVLTGVTGFCPLYVLLRWSTLPKSGHKTAIGSRP